MGKPSSDVELPTDGKPEGRLAWERPELHEVEMTDVTKGNFSLDVDGGAFN